MSREHELYADSAQAREVDRRYQGDVAWVDVDTIQAKSNNKAWLEMLQERDKQHRIQMRAKIASAVDQIGNRWGYMGPRRPQ